MATGYFRREIFVLEGGPERVPLSLGATPYWVSGLLGAVAAIAAAATFFVPAVLRGTAVMNGSARGTALVVLFVAVPSLALSMHAVARSSSRAAIVWLGAVAYIAYNAVLFVFATPFNNLFLVYVAMLSLSIWSLVTTLHAIDVRLFATRFSPLLPARAIAAYAIAIAALNAVAWLRQVVPAMLSSTPPSFLDGTGLPTNPVFVQDLALWLPLMGVAAVWLWRRAPWGFVITGALLTTYVIEAVGVAADQWFGHAADPASSVASAAAVPMFAALAVIGLAPLYFFLRNLDRSGGHSAG